MEKTLSDEADDGWSRRESLAAADQKGSSSALFFHQPRPQGLLAFQYGGAGEKTLAHSELKRSLIGAFHCAFIRALSLVYSFQNKDGYPLRAS